MRIDMTLIKGEIVLEYLWLATVRYVYENVTLYCGR